MAANFRLPVYVLDFHHVFCFLRVKIFLVFKDKITACLIIMSVLYLQKE